MPLSAADVRHLARLARLDLDDAAVARMTTELGTIIAHIEQLRQVDTTGVPPMAHAGGDSEALRDDVPGPMLSVAEVLANAPQADGRAFLVPKAVER